MRGIDIWVEAGIPAPAIFKAMTTDAVRLLGVDAQRGALKAGMAADFIATPGNPLDDIQTLKKVIFVIKNGQIVKAPK
jgi:imidazolonepropionase-like amidohydrolase